MDRLDAMGSFLAVVDEGGFAAAARKLNISPSVVTRAVSDLEAAMGVRLLIRTTRIVRVTEIGARYADDCRRILSDIAAAEETAAGTHGSVRGRLVVTASALFGRMYVVNILNEYLNRYPETQIDCRLVDRVVNMVDEGVDVAVRIGPLQDSSYQATRVGEVRRVVCASPAYLEQHGAPTSPDDLARHTVISSTGLTPSNDWQFIRNKQPVSVRIQPRLNLTTNDAALAAALDGFGIARTLSYMVAQDLAAGRLVELLQDFRPDSLPIHVMHHEGRHAAQKVRAFLDMAIRALRGDPALQ